MYPKIILLLGAAGALMLAACGNFGAGITRGSGTLKTETRQVSGISAVALDTSGELSLSQGTTEALTIEAEDNILPLLTSEIVNGTLKLGITPNGSFSNTKPVRYTLVVQDLSAIELNGSGSATASDLTITGSLKIDISGSGSLSFATLRSGEADIHLSGSGGLTMSALNSPGLTIEVSGSGDAAISALMADRLSANLSGNGELTVGGSVADQQVTLSGSGSYNGQQLSSASAAVETSGSGSAFVHVTERLDARVSGSGNITYTGSPTVTQEDHGAGNIRQS